MTPIPKVITNKLCLGRLAHKPATSWFELAAGASHKMGKVQAPPKLNLKHFSGMQFETRSSLTLPTNLEKPFYIERSALARARGH